MFYNFNITCHQGNKKHQSITSYLIVIRTEVLELVTLGLSQSNCLQDFYI